MSLVSGDQNVMRPFNHVSRVLSALIMRGRTPSVLRCERWSVTVQVRKGREANILAVGRVISSIAAGKFIQNIHDLIDLFVPVDGTHVARWFVGE